MKRSSIVCRAWAVGAAFVLLAAPVRAEDAPDDTAITVLLPGDADGFWAWALRPEALPPGLNLRLRFAGPAPGAVGEQLLVDTVARDLPDLALVAPEEIDPLRVEGLLANLEDEASVDAWRHERYAIGGAGTGCGRYGPCWELSAGIVVPLVLARPEEAGRLPESPTWSDLLALEPVRELRPGDVTLDPGELSATYEWLRLRAGLIWMQGRHEMPPMWPAVLNLMRELHNAPSATRFWQKRWAPDTPTFRRGRARMAIADTGTIRLTGNGVDGVRGLPLPPIEYAGRESDNARYPVRIPAAWIVTRAAHMERVRPLLQWLLSPEFAAVVARGRGWAPTRRDAWDAMADVVERVPAWQMVRRMLDARELLAETTFPSDHLFVRAAGLHLAGSESTPESAWQLAWTSARAVGRGVRQPGERLSLPPLLVTNARVAPESARTFHTARGEHVLLPLALPDGVDLQGARLRLRGEAATRSLVHAIYVLRPNRDELRVVPEHQGPDSVNHWLYVDFQVPGDIAPGSYELELGACAAQAPHSLVGAQPLRQAQGRQAAPLPKNTTYSQDATRAAGDRELEETTAVPIGEIRVTEASPLAPIPALCGLGLAADSPYADAVGRLLLEHGFTPFPLALDSPLLRDPRRGPIVLRQWHDPSKAEADAKAAAAAGVKADLLVYSHDEPTLLHFPHIQHESATYKRLGTRVLVAHPPDPLLFGHVQVWGVHTVLRPTDTPSARDEWRRVLPRIREVRGRGHDVWWYTAGDVAPLPNLQLDADRTQLRAAFYRLPTFGFSGVLQAAAAAWGPDPNDLDKGALGVGEGILCFPAPGEDAAVNPTLRLKALRDGLFTMRLLFALREQLAAQSPTGWESYPDERLAAYGRSVVQPAALALGDAVHPLMHLTTDAQRLQYVGAQLRLELGAAAHGPSILLRGDCDDWSVTTREALTLTGRVKPGATVRAQGGDVPVEPDGAFTWRTSLDLGWNAPELVITDAGRVRRVRWHVWRAAPPPLSGS